MQIYEIYFQMSSFESSSDRETFYPSMVFAESIHFFAQYGLSLILALIERAIQTK